MGSSREYVRQERRASTRIKCSQAHSTVAKVRSRARCARTVAIREDTAATFGLYFIQIKRVVITRVANAHQVLE